MDTDTRTFTIVERESEYRGPYAAASTWEDATALRDMGLAPWNGVPLEVYDEVVRRIGRTFTLAQAEALAAEWKQRRAEREAKLAASMVKCDCGHTVPVAQVMSASRGTACLDCYDRMSE